jgi:hypothetical protein
MSFTFSSILSDTNSSCNLRELPSPPSPQERLKRSRYKATFGVFWLVFEAQELYQKRFAICSATVGQKKSRKVPHSITRICDLNETLCVRRAEGIVSLSLFFLTHSLTANQGAILTVHLSNPTTGSSHRVLKSAVSEGIRDRFRPSICRGRSNGSQLSSSFSLFLHRLAN